MDAQETAKLHRALRVAQMTLVVFATLLGLIAIVGAWLRPKIEQVLADMLGGASLPGLTVMILNLGPLNWVIAIGLCAAPVVIAFVPGVNQSKFYILSAVCVLNLTYCLALILGLILPFMAITTRMSE